MARTHRTGSTSLATKDVLTFVGRSPQPERETPGTHPIGALLVRSGRWVTMAFSRAASSALTSAGRRVSHWVTFRMVGEGCFRPGQ